MLDSGMSQCRIEAYGHLGDFEDPRVISKSTNDDSNLVFTTGFPHVASQARDGKRRTVDPRHKQSLQNDAVKLGLGTPCQKSVEL